MFLGKTIFSSSPLKEEDSAYVRAGHCLLLLLVNRWFQKGSFRGWIEEVVVQGVSSSLR